MKRGIFVVVDGIDGSGKGIVVNSLASWAEDKNLKILDLRKYWKKHNDFPKEKEISNYDCIISAEPTFTPVGRVIREEIIQNNGRSYSAKVTATTLSLDREILYKRIIIPALEQGKYIFQERSVSSSLVYQPIQQEPLSLQEIMEMSGNNLALEHRPDLLLIAEVDPREAIGRLKLREKKDNAIFESLDFLAKSAERFNSSWFSDLFKKRGSKVKYLKTDKNVCDTIKKSLDIWENYLNN